MGLSENFNSDVGGAISYDFRNTNPSETHKNIISLEPEAVKFENVCREKMVNEIKAQLVHDNIQGSNKLLLHLPDLMDCSFIMNFPKCSQMYLDVGHLIQVICFEGTIFNPNSKLER